MFRGPPDIRITIKLYGGLDRLSRVDGYDPQTGIERSAPRGVQLGRVMRRLGLHRCGPVALFVNGEKANPRRKLQDGDVVFCMKHVSGG